MMTIMMMQLDRIRADCWRALHGAVGEGKRAKEDKSGSWEADGRGERDGSA